MTHCLDPDVIDLRSLEIGGGRTTINDPYGMPTGPQYTTSRPNGDMLHYNHLPPGMMSQPNLPKMNPYTTAQAINMNAPSRMSGGYRNTMPNGPMEPPYSAPHIKSEYGSQYPAFNQQRSMDATSYPANPYPTQTPPNSAPAAAPVGNKPPSFDFSKFAMMPAKAIDSIYAKLYPTYKPTPQQMPPSAPDANYTIPSPVGYSKHQNGYGLPLDMLPERAYMQGTQNNYLGYNGTKTNEMMSAAVNSTKNNHGGSGQSVNLGRILRLPEIRSYVGTAGFAAQYVTVLTHEKSF